MQNGKFYMKITQNNIESKVIVSIFNRRNGRLCGLRFFSYVSKKKKKNKLLWTSVVCLLCCIIQARKEKRGKYEDSEVDNNKDREEDKQKSLRITGSS